MKPVRGIRIDAERRVVEEVTIASLEDAQAAVGGYLERVHSLDAVNELYADEEGRLKDLHHAFHFQGCPHDVLVGSGLIVGGDDETGDWIDATIPVAEVSRRVSWLSAVNVDRGIAFRVFSL